MQNKEIFGFYQVGNFKTYSKLEAIEYSGATGQPISWNYNVNRYSQFDWTQEPPGSLEFWYRARAQQIREQYDYIVLWYSGGADSHNMLMSFVNNNIFVDEIAQFHNLSAAHGDKTTFLNEEVFATSAPLTQQLITTNPTYRNTRHRLVDLTDLELDLFQRDDNHWDYFYKVNTYYSPNALCRSYMRERIPDYQELINQGKRVCFVIGIEKPAISQVGNTWYIDFEDRIDYGVSPRNQMLARDWEYDEYFYWAPDMPELPCKQAHVIRRYLEKVTDSAVDGVNIADTHSGPGIYGEHTNQNIVAASIQRDQRRYYLLMPGLHRLIYPNWNPEAIVCGKPASLTFSARDRWMFEGQAPDMGQQAFVKGLLWMRQRVKQIDPALWWEFKYDPRVAPYKGGTKQFKNSYTLGPVAPQIYHAKT